MSDPVRTRCRPVQWNRGVGGENSTVCAHLFSSRVVHRQHSCLLGSFKSLFVFFLEQIELQNGSREINNEKKNKKKKN